MKNIKIKSTTSSKHDTELISQTVYEFNVFVFVCFLKKFVSVLKMFRSLLVIPGDDGGLLIGKHPSDLFGGVHVVLNAFHQASILPIPDHLGSEIPDASVEAELGHGVVGLEELPKGYLRIVAELQFRRHLVSLNNNNNNFTNCHLLLISNVTNALLLQLNL
jgi:hypothetical protein